MRTTDQREPAVQSATASSSWPAPWRRLVILTAVLVLCFAKPLYELVRFALQNDLYSHILLIPFVSLYLAYLKKSDLLASSSSPPLARATIPLSSPGGEGRGEEAVQPSTLNPQLFSALPLAAGLASIISFLWLRSRLQLAPVDCLAWTTFSFFLLFIAVCCFCLGRKTLGVLAFPIGFLIFMVPFPVALENGFVSFLQHRSADGAELLFGIAGTPLLRHGVDFYLPGFSLQVAPECSGIRSTLVLFITSLVAGQLFLRSNPQRAVLAFAVIPLAIFRNAFRIVTIGELCIHISPDMIDSPLHHRGGPFFFLLSLVPFLGLLYILRKLEWKRRVRANVAETISL
jgi:exosortase C (VPDSG-CTERM-specific)